MPIVQWYAAIHTLIWAQEDTLCRWMTSLRMVGWEKCRFPVSLNQQSTDERLLIRVCPCREETSVLQNITSSRQNQTCILTKLVAKIVTAHCGRSNVVAIDI